MTPSTQPQGSFFGGDRLVLLPGALITRPDTWLGMGNGESSLTNTTPRRRSGTVMGVKPWEGVGNGVRSRARTPTRPQAQA